ncbi:tetratricopeptide repeat protein [Nocardioides donggukensis]|uniref:Tetratricopeptide repeat protein n=1 Tax=Nocardioides donggukensis TaxID=2774019 RepID=A0A927K5G9_9ACTN|nr:tetratricopeptide repeat protein [Nocardioides donggukensis]MBD8870168.1 tetratricopeptide repeat protein [Nocardioides donggukensis]
MYRLIWVGAIALVLSVSGAIGLVRGADDTAPAPATAQPADLGTAGRDTLTTYVSSLQDRLRRLPDDELAWARLGLGYVELARVSGNPGLYEQADEAIATSLSLQSGGNAPAHAARAALSAARHDFSDSLAAADRALAINPYDAAALAVRVDALAELGRYDAQLRALRTADRRQPGVPVAARYAYAMELRGRLDEAARILRRSVRTPQAADRSFLLTLLSEVERRRGRPADARRIALQALEQAPTNVAARVALARALVADRRWSRASAEWEQVVETLPLPEYQVELGELHELRDRTEQAEEQYAVVATTNAAFASGGVNTDLESALFEADHGDTGAAVVSARAEWDRRKSVLVADVLAWSLHRDGDSREALGLARTATRLGTAESRLWLHRGLIEAELGLDGQARDHLRRGLDLDRGTALLLTRDARAALDRLEARA